MPLICSLSPCGSCSICALSLMDLPKFTALVGLLDLVKGLVLFSLAKLGRFSVSSEIDFFNFMHITNRYDYR